jgi:hypothetical protein
MTKFSYEKSYKDKKIIKCRRHTNKNTYPTMFKQKLCLADKNEIISILEKKLKDYVDNRLNELLNNKTSISEQLEEDIDEVKFDETFGDITLNDLNNEQIVKNLDDFYVRLEENNVKEITPLLEATEFLPQIGETTPLLLGERVEIFPILEDTIQEVVEEIVEEYPEDFEEETEDEDIYCQYQPVSFESDNEDIFDIEAQQYIPLEDLSQSIIIDNDDFIIKEIQEETPVERYDDFLNLESILKSSPKVKDVIVDTPILNITEYPPLPSSSSDEIDGSCSRSRSVSPSPSSFTEEEREKVLNNLLNLNDFKKEIKPVGEELEVNEIITTRNGLKIQKTQSGRFIITEILNSIDKIDNNNDIDIFCDIDPTVDELSQQLSELNLNEETEIAETFSGETLMNEYDESNNKKENEYFELVMEEKKESEEEDLEIGEAGYIGEESDKEEKKEIVEFAFNYRKTFLPAYNECDLPKLDYYTEVYPKSGVPILEPIIESDLPIIEETEREVIAGIAEKIVDDVIKEVVEKIAREEEDVRSDKTSYEEESDKEESIYKLVASRSLYYGEHRLPLIVTHRQDDGQNINYHKSVEEAKEIDNSTLYPLMIEEEEYYSSEYADDEFVEDSLSAVNNLLQSKTNERVIQDYAIEIPEEKIVEEKIVEEKIVEEEISQEEYSESEESYIPSSDEIEEQNWSFRKWFFGL